MTKTNISLVTKKSVFNKVIPFVTVGLTAVSIFAVSEFISKYEKKAICEKNAESVLQSIQSGNYSAASELLNSFSESGSLEERSAVSLRNTLFKSKVSSEISSLLSSGKIVEAQALLEKSQEKFSAWEVGDLERKLEPFSEPNLFKRIISSEAKDKTDLCTEYLNNFPDSENYTSVINELAYSSLRSLLSSLRSERSIKETRNKVEKVSEILRSYSSSRIEIPKDIKDELSVENFKAHSNVTYTPLDKRTIFDLKVGDQVRVHQMDFSHYGKDYSEQRLISFPLGSIGSVEYVDYDSDKVFVRFPESEKQFWESDWPELTPYWNDSKNIAYFDISEVEAAKPSDPLERGLLIEDAKRLNDLISNN